ncbi:hypothetical protein [Nodularia sp. UHCC 0506]|uniref:hypothetical protein n=1 Tax=Nodularia sp. UHCC 0506 TaxID=3110243 RepID=UPI002B219720|nr:hypothetical protein [Nodularia sp. UHCC 0506]MEA5514053.1 hypothetical protein [Nodularia sp. UHCC 0506]
MDNYQVNNEHHNDLPKEVIELFKKQWISFNDDQKNDILQGNAQLRVNCFYPKAVKKKDILSRKPIDKTHQYEDLDYTQLSQRLDELNSREEGIDFLKSSFSTKKSLESFAKFLKISTQKQNLQELRESIVSATIGYRLTIQFIEKRRRPKLEYEFLDKNEKFTQVVEFCIFIDLELYFLFHIELLLVQLFHYSHLSDQI